MAPKSPFNEVKLIIRCFLCRKVIGYTDSISIWALKSYCDNKKCKKEHMMSKLNG